MTSSYLIHNSGYEKSLKEIVTRHENDPRFMSILEHSDDKNIQKVTELFKNQDITKEHLNISRDFER